MAINVSDSGPMKAEVAKLLGKQGQINATNLHATPSLEQTVHGNPYGKDGMHLSEKDQYHPGCTILPNSEMEKSRQKLKKEGKKNKKKKEEKKKKNFWQWLFAK